MSGFHELSRKEALALGFGLILNATVFGAAIYQVYYANTEHTVEFRVFEINIDYWPELRQNQTQVLTWGTGKYYFIGTWSNTFQPNHSYRVTYVQKVGAKRPWQNLIILDWEEIL